MSLRLININDSDCDRLTEKVFEETLLFEFDLFP